MSQSVCGIKEKNRIEKKRDWPLFSMRGEGRFAAGADNWRHDHFVVALSLGGIDYHVIFISKGRQEKAPQTEREGGRR